MTDESIKTKIEAATFRKMLKHLQDNKDLQNIDYIFVETHEKKIEELNFGIEQLRKKIEDLNLHTIIFWNWP